MSHPLALALTAGALLWAAAIVVAPVALAHPTWSTATSYAYHAAARVCHQRPERSFHVRGHPMPVCARCAGLYGAGAIGALLAWGAFARAGVGRSRAWLIAAAVPTALTWGLEVAGLVPFSNPSRAVAALPLGAVSGWLFVRMLRYDAPLDADQVADRSSRARSA